jgi:riboflavin kinase / FMN adenylyltransferase
MNADIHPYSFTSSKIQGKGRGKRMGLATLNLSDTHLDIDFGIYIVQITVDDKIYTGLMHYGPVVTFNEGVSTELYVEETIENIEDPAVKVTVLKRLRNVLKFNTTEALVEKINEDIYKLKKYKKLLDEQ